MHSAEIYWGDASIWILGSLEPNKSTDNKICIFGFFCEIKV